MVKLAEDEKIVTTVRKHWFLPLIHTINISILFVIPFIAIFFLLGRKISINEMDITLTFGQPSFLIFELSLWGLVLWLRYFSFWTDHHLDGWVLTNKRIVDIEQKGFFKREVASFRLERLQDVTIEVNGFLATILDFGDVHVQTAGADKEFIMRNAPKPKEVKALILKQYDSVIERTSSDVDAVGSQS
jgi:uncharacterized membrane protein YdbT with pleckstrin-like domain